MNPLNELLYMTQTIGAGRLPYSPQDQNYRQAQRNFFRGGLTEAESNFFRGGLTEQEAAAYDRNQQQAENNFFRGRLTEEQANAYEQEPVTRAELEQRAYQNEASRLGQQVDPFLRGGSPMLGYDANAGMTINQALYGNQTSLSTPNPLMMGLNYNMQEPVGQEQSMAQAMADRFRNDQMQFQTGGMGAEPGMLSGMDPSMFLARLEAFEPGGPRRSKGGKG
jgi:hypothetical protein